MLRLDDGTNWALILGASSGFGAAAARKLAEGGLNIFGVHLDRRATMPQVEALVEELRSKGVKVKYFNVNAADDRKRAKTVEEIRRITDAEGGKIKVLMHSLAFGTLKPYIGETPEEDITRKNLEMTIDIMGNSLVYWVRDVFRAGLFHDDARVFAMTSAGSHRVYPAYGPVSAAKAVLEAHVRQLAFELGGRGIRVNAIQAGVTDTPALRKIPGHERMLEWAKSINPSGRLTTPEDVANVIALLSRPEAYWVNGAVIRVDGGEDLV
ncbi:MAG: SDR family oxidoreductase [Thermotogae bacterium]|nr:SDR family oxidoreductase [Thermotogota bacterium]